MSSDTPAAPDRRRVMLAGSALVGAAMLPKLACAQDGLGSAAGLTGAVRKFLAGLEPDKRKAASFAFNAPQWRNWDYFGSGNNIKPGLRLEQMSAAQKDGAWDVLATLLSPAGMEKTKNVMTLQD